MKKIGIWLFCIFVLFASIYAVLTGDFGRNFTRNLIVDTLQKAGFETTIDQIDGTIPHQIRLKNVSLKKEDFTATVEEVQLKVTLWRLLEKELAFNRVEAKQIKLNGSDGFDFSGKLRLNAKMGTLAGDVKDWTIGCRMDWRKKLGRFNAKNDLLNARGTLVFDDQFQFTSSQFQLSSDQILKKLSAKTAGRFLAHLVLMKEGPGYKIRGNWQIPNLYVDSKKLGAIKGKADATWQNGHLVADLSAEPAAKAHLDIQNTPQGLVGTAAASIDNLQTFHIPNIYGQLEAKADLQIHEGVQELRFDATASAIYYHHFFAAQASIYSDIQDPFNKRSGLLDIEFQNAKWNDLRLESISLETSIGAESFPFKLFAEGEWKHPLEIHANGNWDPSLKVRVESLDGQFFNHPFTLSKPFELTYTSKKTTLTDLEMALGSATIFGHLNRDQDNTKATLQLHNLPLDLLSLNPLDVSVGGTIDLDANLQETNNVLQGKLKANVQNVEVAGKLFATGAFEGSFDRDLLHMQGHFNTREDPILKFDLSLPIHFSVWPFKADLLFHKEAKGSVFVNGRVEDFIDFIDLGSHRLEGQCNAKFNFSNTLYRPLVDGYLFFEDGFYQNYYTGTELHNIQSEFFAEKNQIYLRSLTAQDRLNGKVSAHGEIKLLQSDLYPFQIEMQFNRLQFVEIDLVNATATGQIHIEGNASSAIAKGNVEIIQSDLYIPDHIPRPLPDLKVIYKNQIHPVALPKLNFTSNYPLYLDLHVTAPDSVVIQGRGLDSRWRGDFHMGGTLTTPTAKGSLDLIKGEFSFSSRDFRLTEGSLSLSGIEHEMPYLNLSGDTETGGITITASLRGPLNNPKLILQSYPPLPLGSIMSYLLFGQDVSEIGGFQALQLASSLASLAGTGPDIMESTRKSLGIDRLRIITDPTEEGGETVALQVGKYVSKGVLVSFTQNAFDTSPNISVEVEIKGNIVLQIENDQTQEQGIFTIKWNLNY